MAKLGKLGAAGLSGIGRRRGLVYPVNLLAPAEVRPLVRLCWLSCPLGWRTGRGYCTAMWHALPPLLAMAIGLLPVATAIVRRRIRIDSYETPTRAKAQTATPDLCPDWAAAGTTSAGFLQLTLLLALADLLAAELLARYSVHTKAEDRTREQVRQAMREAPGKTEQAQLFERRGS